MNNQIWTSFWTQVGANLTDPATRLGAVFYAVVMAFMAWLTGRAVRLAVHRFLERQSTTADQTAIRFLAQLSRLGVWVLAFLCYAHLIPSLKSLGGAGLASVGVVSVVVGMAAQNTLGNLIAGVSLVLYRPFHLGDHLQVAAPGGTETGVVESISLGYTVLRAADERRLVIPNSVIAGQTIINLSLSSQPFPCAVAFTLEHDADMDKARQILLEVARKNPKVVGTPVCRVTNLSGAGVTLTLTARAPDSLAAPDLKSDLLEAAKKELDNAGIKIHRDYAFVSSVKP